MYLEGHTASDRALDTSKSAYLYFQYGLGEKVNGKDLVLETTKTWSLSEAIQVKSNSSLWHG